MCWVINNLHIRKVKLQTYIIFTSVLTLSCTVQETKKTAQNVQIFIQDETIDKTSFLEGEWKLDSVVFTDDNLRGKQQIPFSTTIWSFSGNNKYAVKIYKSEATVTVEGATEMPDKKLNVTIPDQEMKGKYRIAQDKLTTTILGGNITYQIIDHSGTYLHLKSQRVQVPPISEKDKGKIAEHYFKKRK